MQRQRSLLGTVGEADVGWGEAVGRHILGCYIFGRYILGCYILGCYILGRRRVGRHYVVGRNIAARGSIAGLSNRASCRKRDGRRIIVGCLRGVGRRLIISG